MLLFCSILLGSLVLSGIILLIKNYIDGEKLNKKSEETVSYRSSPTYESKKTSLSKFTPAHSNYVPPATDDFLNNTIITNNLMTNHLILDSLYNNSNVENKTNNVLSDESYNNHSSHSYDNNSYDSGPSYDSGSSCDSSSSCGCD